MAATGKSSGSSVLCPLSSSQRLLNHHHHRHHHNIHHHHHHQRSPSPCNLRLKRFSPGNTPKPSVAVSNQKRKCLCSPTTHPGSFRCAFHRRLENDKIGTLASSANRSNCGGNNRTSNPRLNLRKTALANSLAKIGGEEVERFRKYLASTIVKPSSLHIRRCFDFRPRPSRFYALHKDQD